MLEFGQNWPEWSHNVRRCISRSYWSTLQARAFADGRVSSSRRTMCAGLIRRDTYSFSIQAYGLRQLLFGSSL